MIVTLLVGGAFGLGLLLVVRGLRPARPSLEASLRQLRTAGPDVTVATGAGLERATTRVGSSVVTWLEGIGVSMPSTRTDLALMGRQPESLVVQKVLTGVGGLVLVPVTTAALAAGGMHVPLVLPAWTSLTLAVAGFF